MARSAEKDKVKGSKNILNGRKIYGEKINNKRMK